jgi:hypothetical protein
MPCGGISIDRREALNAEHSHGVRSIAFGSFETDVDVVGKAFSAAAVDGADVVRQVTLPPEAYPV